LAIGLLYGLLARLIWGWDLLEDFLGTPVSGSFLFLVPYGLGSLVAFIGMLTAPSSRIDIWGVAMPALAVLTGLLGAFITQLEALFCVIVAAPIIFSMAIMGGTICAILMRAFGKRRTSFYTSVLLFLPYAVAPIEQLFELPEETIAISDSITVNASPEDIWHQIASVPEIQSDEIRQSWIYRLGFPKPRAATLDFEGVGGKRTATFEREVSFFEVIDTWEPPETLSFSIEADPAFVPANAFDQHIILGGRFYDVLDGTYRIEQLDDGRCQLHLTSHHRLASHFNSYAAWWSEVIMREIQPTILEVIAQRAKNSFGSNK
jgi:hypothetical protein